MHRSPRYEVADGIYHVMNRGVQRGNIVCDDEDRREWLRLLGRAAGRCRWRVFAWALLDNHFHLFLRTPLPNLSAGMHRWSPATPPCSIGGTAARAYCSRGASGRSPSRTRAMPGN